MATSKSFQNLYLLMWKNILLKIRRPLDILLIMFLPIVMCLIICGLILLTSRDRYDTVTYNVFNVNNETFNFAMLFWSPCGNPSLTKLVQNIAKSLKTVERCYQTSNDLHNALQYYAIEQIIGLQFQDALRIQNDIDKNMNITLRFADIPVPIGNYWETTSIFPTIQEAGPRGSKNATGAQPHYYDTGFLTVQNHITQEFLKTYTNDQFPAIQIRRFPYPAWVSYKGFTAYVPSIATYIIFALVGVFCSVLQEVSIEKETKIKELMKIMGLDNSLHWIAWYLTTLLYSLLPIALIVIFMTVPIFAENAVFPLLSGFLLFIYLVLYMSAVITFAFAVTVFFSRSNMAMVVGVVLFMVTMFPAFTKHSFSGKLSLCLLVNVAFIYGLEVMAEHEVLYRTLTLSNVFERISPKAQLSLGIVMVMLIIDTIIYMLVALYVEAVFPGEYGLSRVWYFPFTSNFWWPKPRTSPERTYKSFIHEAHYCEPEPDNRKIGIQLLHLKKKYGKSRVVLRDLTCNMFEGEVTVLLGHNGAGKTTTMSILTGVISPTDGSAIVNGYDIRTDMKIIRKSLGFCAQENILFGLLTVTEHLDFYCRLRGLQGQRLKDEIRTYLHLLGLMEKRRTKSKNLSGGMKRKLCVGIALCGNPKVCILDEPTSGMDPTSRRQLWDIIQMKKTGRTILLSTHFMNEADILGDRVAILGSGMLQCYGSSFYLKKVYGRGYRLIIVKKERCKVDAITRLLGRYIPTIYVESEVGTELTYILPDSKANMFEMMLDDLENRIDSLGIQSYGISLATLEEVFMRVGVEHDFDEHILTSISDEGFLGNVLREYRTGFALYINQILAMAMKKALVTLRGWLLFIVHILLPIVLTIVLMHTLTAVEVMQSSPNLGFTLDSYNSPITVITTSDENNLYYNRYKQILQNEKREIIDWRREDMNHRMIKKTREDTEQVRMRFIIGATFLSNNTIVAWFNNEPFHSPPLALQYVHNTIIKEKIGDMYSIQFNNYPSPKSLKGNILDSAPHFYATALGMAMLFPIPYFAIFCVKERRSQSKHLQLVSGTAVSAFWLIAFIWDLGIFLLISVCVIIVLASYRARLHFGVLTILLSLFGCAILPFVYLMSFLFKQPSSAYSAISTLCGLLGFLAFLLVRLVLVVLVPKLAIVDELLLYFPFYNLLCSVNNISLIHSSRQRCSIINKQYDQFDEASNISKYGDFACFLVPDVCCDLEYYSMGNGVGRNIIYLIVTAVTLFLILFLHEYRIGNYVIYKFSSLITKAPQEEGTEDVDVLEEKRLIHSDQIEPTVYPVRLKDLTKYYNRNLIVNQLCLRLKQGECFGLLGVNGAGKTTTFKMMTGEVRMSYGNGWICGWNLKSNVKNAHRCIGYCPQFDALLDNLTVKETLIIYCLIRGIPPHNCESTVYNLAKDFVFNKHMRKKICHLSGGNKRKVSTAIALIGEPLVVFLDEPSTGMDPNMKRHFWNKLCTMRNLGKCLILTTHSMDECEAVCTRVAIMANGAFQCLGSIQHLKNKFSDGYVLIIKVRKTTDELQLQANVTHVDNFVKMNFSGSELREKHDMLLTYVIKSTDISWSKIFGIMEQGKEVVQEIEDYSLSQFDLEQIFLHFALMQKH